MPDPETAGVASTESSVSNSQAGSQTGGTQAGIGAEQRSGTTGANQAGVGASSQGAGADVGMDIGQTEAYTVNMKKLVADELDHAANLRSVALEALRRSQRNAEDYDQTLRNIATQSLQSAVTLQNRVSNGSTDLDTRIKQNSVDHDGRVRGIVEGEVSRTVRHSDLAIDRQWNIDEVSASIAKNPVFQDAIAGAVAAAVAAATASKA